MSDSLEVVRKGYSQVFRFRLRLLVAYAALESDVCGTVLSMPAVLSEQFSENSTFSLSMKLLGQFFLEVPLAQCDRVP